jgi:CDP-diacylglycerol---glycerol-3-phosphate 3-phosphatidyltransferase
MPTLYDIKPAFQRLLRPIVRNLAGAGITANQVTLMAALLSVATGAAIEHLPGRREVLFAVPIVLFVRMALNAIDGMLAREFGQKSRAGAILNEIGDVVSDAALYLPFAFLPGLSSKLVVVVVLLAIISEMTGVVAIQIGASRRYDGPMGKSDRAFLFGVLALLLAFGVPLGPWANVALAVGALLLIITIGNRARNALREKPSV